MLYESQGIFPEGWAFDFRQEARSVTHQHATSARSRTPKAKREADCEQCGKTFVPTNGAVGKCCSHACMHKGRIKSRPVGFECSRCLSTVGIGMAVASRLLGVTKSSIHRSWKREGISAQLPKGVDSWRRYAQRAESPFCGWWGNTETAAMWMSEYAPRFPDWGHEWQKEKKRRDALKKPSRYQMMTPEEKANHNAKTWQRRKLRMMSDDQYRKAMQLHTKAWKTNNPDKNRESIRKSIKKRKASDPGFKVQCNLRNRLKEIMGKVKKGGTEHRNNLTGCSTRQLADHLESTFKRGMTWDNYGTRWHVDHILPCASFDHTDPRQRAQCWHWTNLRALDAHKNMDKGDKITEPQMSLLLCATL